MAPPGGSAPALAAPSVAAGGGERLPLLASSPAPSKHSTFGATVFVLLNTVLGAGIMSLPAVLKVLGVVPGVLAIVLVALVADVTVGLLLSATEANGGRTYAETVRRALGPAAASVLRACVVVNNLGLCVVYLIIVGDCLAGARGAEGALAALGAPAWSNSRPLVVSAVAFALVVPLTSVKRIETLRFASYASAALMALFVATMVALCARSLALGADSPLSKGVRLFPEFAKGSSVAGDVVGELTVFAVMMNSYVCHYNVHALRAALAPDERGRVGAAVRRALLAACAVYVLTAAAAYLVFGEDTMDDALSNLSDARLTALVPFAKELACAVKIGYSCSLVCTYPAINWEVREAVVASVWRGRKGAADLAAAPRLALSVALVALALGASLAIPNIWIAFSFVGSTVAVAIGFLMPALCALRSAPARSRTAALMLLVGLGVSATGVGNSVCSIIRGDTRP